MKHRKIVGWGLVAALALITIVVVFEYSLAVGTVENLSFLGGLAFWVFGIWAAIILLKD